MPQLDIQSPSEDEDFDITSQGTDDISPETEPVETPTTSEPDEEVPTPSVEDPEPAGTEPDEGAGAVSEPVINPDTDPDLESEPATEPSPDTEAQEPEETSPTTSEAEEEVPTPPTEAIEADEKADPEESPAVFKVPITQSNFSDIKPPVTSSVTTPSTSPAVDSSSPEGPNAAVTKPATSQKANHFSWHYVVEAVLLVIVIVLALFAWSLNSDKHDLNKEVASLNANPQAVVQKQTQSLITAVGKLMQLPKDETPTVASVTDATAAKKQSSFFTNAQNGDKVLLYVKSGEAILYRPSTNKIILVAPLTFTTSTTGSTSTTK